MNEQQDLERNEAATPHKLQKAREKGQVAKSTEVSGVAVLAVALVWLHAEGFPGLIALFRFDHRLFDQVGTLSPAAVGLQVLGDAMAMLAPFFACLVIVAVLVNIAQTGPILTFRPLAPDATRLNPANGWQRLFSGRSAFEFVKSMLKMAVLCAIAWLSLKHTWPRLNRVAGLPALGQLHEMLAVVSTLATHLLVAMAVIAAADLAFTRRFFASRMRMSRRELKEEARHREGDPRIRARVRELRRAMLRRAQAVGRTRHADVLITNPTHVAVALEYRHGEMVAPRLIAKGAGVTAAAMRAIAARHAVPVVPSRTLARALYAELEIDHYVPAEHYAAIARIMVWILARRGEQATVGARP